MKLTPILLLILSLILSGGCCVQKPVKAVAPTLSSTCPSKDPRPSAPDCSPHGVTNEDMKADYIGCCVACVEKDDTYCPER